MSFGSLNVYVIIRISAIRDKVCVDDKIPECPMPTFSWSSGPDIIYLVIYEPHYVYNLKKQELQLKCVVQLCAVNHAHRNATSRRTQLASQASDAGKHSSEKLGSATRFQSERPLISRSRTAALHSITLFRKPSLLHTDSISVLFGTVASSLSSAHRISQPSWYNLSDHWYWPLY
jgi:hypothetical protein